MSVKFALGLVINPFAGIGGAMALKGSDGADIRAKALAMGAEKLAMDKARRALEVLVEQVDDIRIVTAEGDMGQDLADSLGFEVDCVYAPSTQQTEGDDTIAAAEAVQQSGVDLLLFAGGDGTARNVFSAIGAATPVLGIPAGVKIHSGVFAVTPKGAGRVAAKMAQGEMVSLMPGEVRDIDEISFRQGQVKTTYFGEMNVPQELSYVQAVKMGGKESDELVLQDIADFVIEQMEDEVYVMGSGSTIDFVMGELGLANTLLGVDIVRSQALIQSDLTAPELVCHVSNAQAQGVNVKLVVTAIGGQGHVFGRGNQQLSPAVIRAIGIDNILLLASKSKLNNLQGRPLLVDTGDEALDAELEGYLPVITGYNDRVLYPVAAPGLAEHEEQ